MSKDRPKALQLYEWKQRIAQIRIEVAKTTDKYDTANKAVDLLVAAEVVVYQAMAEDLAQDYDPTADAEGEVTHE